KVYIKVSGEAEHVAFPDNRRISLDLIAQCIGGRSTSKRNLVCHHLSRNNIRQIVSGDEYVANTSHPNPSSSGSSSTPLIASTCCCRKYTTSAAATSFSRLCNAAFWCLLGVSLIIALAQVLTQTFDCLTHRIQRTIHSL